MPSVICVAEAISIFFSFSSVTSNSRCICLNYWLHRPFNPEVVITAVAQINPGLILSVCIHLAALCWVHSVSIAFTLLHIYSFLYLAHC
jgi:hypothetical protein